MKKYYLFFVVFLNFHHKISCQIGGESVFTFLNTPTSARQVALGGNTLTFLDNVDQATWNPAIINPSIDRKLSANYTSFLAGISIGSVSYAHQFNRRVNPIHTNITYVNYGDLIAADEEGKETGTFNASDIAFSLGYSFNIPNSDFYVGTNIRFINSSIANFSSSGLSTDLGIIYYAKNKPYILTLVARNMGTQLNSFDEKKEYLPFELSLAGSYQLENVPLRWYVTINNLQRWKIGITNPSNNTTDLDGNITQDNVSFLDNLMRHIVVGAELFPDSAINLRIGYNFRRGKELQLENIRTFGGLSFGFGLRMNRIKINYAYSEFHTASNVSTFGVEIDLFGKKKGRNPVRF